MNRSELIARYKRGKMTSIRYNDNGKFTECPAVWHYVFFFGDFLILTFLKEILLDGSKVWHDVNIDFKDISYFN